MKEIAIGAHKIGQNHPPLIVAELSGNHRGSLKNALKAVDAAKAAGVDAIKLQTYTTDTITLNSREPGFIIEDEASLWRGKSLYELYQEAYTPWEWHATIFKHCREIGLTAFSTPFDETAVDFLEDLRVPCYKIASLEIVDLPLIRKVAATGKPMIMSVGGASLVEINDAVETARRTGCDDLVLLKCTAAYPARPSDSHLRTLPNLSSHFNALVGISDHTLGLGVPLASIAFGCCLIEKHMILSRAEEGVDAAFSLEPHEFKLLVEESKRAWEALGEVHYKALDSEKTMLRLRPSLFFVCDLAAGEIIQSHHVKSLRPNLGLPPKEIDLILGMPVTHAVKKGTPVSWDVIKKG